MTYEQNLWLLLSAWTPAKYNKYRLQTGLCKPTLFSGLTMLGIPNIFTMDLMHLSVLNDPDLLLGLWRGTIKHYPPNDVSTWDWAVLKDQKQWKAHGETIKAAVPFIPSSFGHTRRLIFVMHWKARRRSEWFPSHQSSQSFLCSLI
jgi:hypothetical protein